jgi:protein tyrosine phosphatase (PTP) superfamily phosphohydrolase (DUF442 family)
MSVSRLVRRLRAGLRTGVQAVTVLGLASLAALAFSGCGSTPAKTSTSPAATAPIPDNPSFDAKGDLVGIEHYRRWSPRLGQGGQPVGDAAFANLASLGYKTVVSVDGLKPDLASAAKYGLRYVHVPFGYDGVPRDAQVKIVKAVLTSDGPTFIHCHHGVARGPAGAMIARIAVEDISNAEAEAELKASGCSDKYKGLYRDVLAAVPPTAEELDRCPADLPCFVSSGDVADHMASLDRTWAKVGAAKNAAWQTKDVDAPHEARLLWEQIREIGRLGDVESHGPEYLESLQKAEEAGHSLEDALSKNDRDAATKHFAVIKQACDSCHARWRDTK